MAQLAQPRSAMYEKLEKERQQREEMEMLQYTFQPKTGACLACT